MSIKTAEHITTQSETSFLEYVKQQLDQNAIDEVAELWVDNPGERIAHQLDELSQLYSGRTDRETYHWSNSVDELNTFATRDAKQEQLEEIYTIYDRYSSAQSDYQTREYVVSVLGEDGYRIHVLADQSVQVYNYPGRAQDQVRDADEEADKIRDFFYRSLIATVRTTDRDPAARKLADQDAIGKLEVRLYGGRKHTAGIE